jgi:hypothetical protein
VFGFAEQVTTGAVVSIFDRHDLLLQQVDLGDIAAACRARLGAA